MAKKRIEIFLVLTYLGISIKLLGLIIGVIIARNFGNENYNVLEYTISELGMKINTPCPYILSLTNIISSILLFFFTPRINRSIDNWSSQSNCTKNPRIVISGLYFLVILGAFLNGFTTLDVSYTIHVINAGIQIFGFIIMGWIFALYIMKKKFPLPKFSAIYLMIIPFLFTLLFLFEAPPSKGIIYEWLLLVSMLIWFLYLARKIQSSEN
ncbi:MAG: DUF998 domain-containing protein [Candidatus Hodarchaeota archaeon]